MNTTTSGTTRRRIRNALTVYQTVGTVGDNTRSLAHVVGSAVTRHD